MQEPIRILHVIGIMDRGGAEAMIMNLYRNIDRTRIQFDFVVHSPTSGVYEPEIRALGGKFYHCPKFTPKNLPAYTKWWNNFFRSEGKQYTLVHGHIGSSAAVYLSIAKKYRKFTIAHSHNTSVVKSLMQNLYDVAAYPTRYIADYFFACSREAGVDRYGSKVVLDKFRFSVLNNAIDTAQYAYSQEIRNSVRNSLGIAPHTTVIGHVGRFAPQKNHTFLLDIFAAAAKKCADLHLLLAGDGPLRTEMEQKAKNLGIAEKVTFLGIRSDVNELLMAMDVFLFPSLYEGLGVVLIEAQTAGLPCLVSHTIPDEATLADVLIFRHTLVASAEDWSNHLLKILQEKGSRNSQVEQACAKGYDIHTTAKWLEEFYLGKAKQH